MICLCNDPWKASKKRLCEYIESQQTSSILEKIREKSRLICIPRNSSGDCAKRCAVITAKNEQVKLLEKLYGKNVIPCLWLSCGRSCLLKGYHPASFRYGSFINSFRRTQLTELYRDGCSLRSIQHISGHRSLQFQSHQEYLDVDKDEVVETLYGST